MSWTLIAHAHSRHSYDSLSAPGALVERAVALGAHALAWHGVAMVECKRTPEGDFVLMEINAKFWGSHDLALAAGVNFPGDLVALLEGRALSEP